MGIYPKDAQSYHKDTCSTMFIAALFIIARTWKQPRCPSTEEWIKKMWYIYTMEHYSASFSSSRVLDQDLVLGHIGPAIFMN